MWGEGGVPLPVPCMAHDERWPPGGRSEPHTDWWAGIHRPPLGWPILFWPQLEAARWDRG